MKKSLLEVYGLAVCFFAVACFVIGLGIALYDVVQIVAPDFTLNRFRYEQLQSNDEYRNAPGAIAGKSDAERKAMPEAEITRRREVAYAQSLRAERRDAEQSLVRTLLIILVDVVTFVVHWRVARRARQGST